ncbi:MAG: PfkB family carbohydrate kinase [Methylophilaceae bacterium]
MYHIALFGEVLADIFPDQIALGGAPYNATRHLRAFQQHPVLISKVGSDALKEQLLTELSRWGIDQSGIQFDAVHPTGQVTVHIENAAHHFKIHPNQAYDYIETYEATQVTTSINPSLIYFGTLAQRNDVSNSTLNRLLKNSSCPRFLDINLRAPWYNKAIIEYSLLNANIVKVSEEELQIVAQLFECRTNNSEDYALFLISKFDLTTLFVTCGENGAWALSSTGEESKVYGQNLESTLVDTVGAGDAFSAISILGTLYNWTIEETLNQANAFAAEICKIRGATPETDDLYMPFIKKLYS